jgi:predicted PolB exonuclease-like 3'-5' exonuclease
MIPTLLFDIEAIPDTVGLRALFHAPSSIVKMHSFEKIHGK